MFQSNAEYTAFHHYTSLGCVDIDFPITSRFAPTVANESGSTNSAFRFEHLKGNTGGILWVNNIRKRRLQNNANNK